ncbi:gliding motility lipoprotein GldB [Flavicella sediminum]|uniref:gliding motility lipoprotein GldB n=1 Tax=Flavicella sediminum TaxID=2585141 RepID=UPI001122C9CF|nr:gliding motility lipoprotein GldB [Flavicella sediminum]
MKYYLFGVALFLVFIQCKTDTIKTVDVSNINVQTEFIDFHKQFYQLKPTELLAFKKKHAFLFPSAVPDSIWLAKLKDPNEQLLFSKVDSVFGSCIALEAELLDLMKHIKYYKPSFKSPKTYSLITDLDYENNVVYADSLLFISLDMFLGATSEVYASFPEYLSENYTKEQVVISVAKEIAAKNFPIQNGRTFLERIIYKGKQLYLLQKLLPKKEDSEIIGYSKEKFAWAMHNESQIWAYFVSNELLYSTDQKLNARFIDPAPFSKFYLDMDKESPGGIGKWLGWTIVNAYMQTNKKTLSELLQTDAETIFRKSKYKPKK